MRRVLKALLPRPVLNLAHLAQERWIRTYARDSYSQEGEDLVLERFFEGRESGFYVDIGAHHPRRFSNTYRFYLRGWRGLNIDANPGSMKLFDKVRPRDINVEAAVSSTPLELTYYAFNEPALNTLSRELALERVGGPYVIEKEIKIQTSTLSQLLDRYLPPGTHIDFMTVDVEGLDHDVLVSNDWARYSPEFVLAECLHESSLTESSTNPVARLLRTHGYAMVAKTANTVIFRRPARN